MHSGRNRRDHAGGQRRRRLHTPQHAAARTYVVQRRRGLWRDGDPERVPLPGQEVHAGIGQFANRAAGGGALRRRGRPPRVPPPEPRINATLCNSAADVCLRATRRIRAGEEVYIGCGATYTVRAPPAEGKRKRKQRGASAEGLDVAAAVQRRATTTK